MLFIPKSLKDLWLLRKKELISISFILAACYTVINFLLLPHNHLIGYPVYMDDYHGLSFGFASISYCNPRPVFYFLAPFFAQLDITGYYLLALALVILCAAEVFYFGQRFFSRSLSSEWLILYGALVFSSPFIIEISKFLGMAINLCSALLAIISMHALLTGYRENKTPFFILAAVFYTLSIFTKEDFILPNFVLIFYLFFFEKQPKTKLFLFSLYTVLTVIALILFNKFIAHSVFTGMAGHSAPYTINHSFSSIFKVSTDYLTSNIHSIIVLIGVFFAFILKPNVKLLFLCLIILSLIMPYAVLPNHTAYFYTYNWLPWESAAIVLSLSFLTQTWPKKISYIFVGIISILLILITYPHRHYVSEKYEQNVQRNKNMISTLVHYKAQLNKTEEAGIVNVRKFAVWMIGNGDYFRLHLGLTPKWIVFPDNHADCRVPPISYLYFKADGTGTLSTVCSPHK